MFAAARFSDFPDLRELRDKFQERYGNSVENYVNKEVFSNQAEYAQFCSSKLCYYLLYFYASVFEELVPKTSFYGGKSPSNAGMCFSIFSKLGLSGL